MRTIWTGFDPFGPHSYNPSRDAARSAAERCVGDASFVCLSVEFERAREWVHERLRDSSPDAVVQFGLGASRESIDLETTAVNVRGTRADARGEGRDRPGRLCAEAAGRLRTPAPVRRSRDALAARLDESDLPPVSISHDAGDYVCNALYFSSLREVRDLPEDERPAVYFVHLPPLEPDEARRIGRVFADVIEKR